MKMSVSGTKEANLQVVIKDKDDPGDDDSDGGDDSEVKLNAGSKKDGGKKLKKKQSKKAAHCNPVTQCSGKGKEPRIVIDPGTEFEVIGGIGWEMVEQVSKAVKMGGALAGIQGPTLPIINAICAVDCATTGMPVLLGIGGAAWDDRKEQAEALINSH